MKIVVALLVLMSAAGVAQAAPADPAGAQRYQQCLASAGSEPKVAIGEATRWLGSGGGIPARHCLALAYLANRDFAAAALALEAAARAAETARDPYVAELWAQAGNAALAGGKPDAALGYLTTAAAAAMTNPPGRAQILIDRARALVDLKREPEARADLDTSIRLDPAFPYGWLLRATLARRQGDLAVAETNILEAAKRAPDDADIQLEAGNVAAAQGRAPLARQAWQAAVAAAPGSPAATAASAALVANPN